MPRLTDDAYRPVAGRRAMDRHAVKAVGDLLMLGVWLERRSRGLSERVGSFHRSGVLRRF
jgi:hypothetical protein